MFTGFDLTLQDSSWEKIKELYLKEGNLYLETLSKNLNIKDCIARYIKNDIVDGKSMTQDWFPTTKADIFISHSHNDLEKVVSLAGLLYNKFGLKSFVDFYVWGFADDLLKEIDKNYCCNGKVGYYSYEKRNYSTAHVHTMLSISLAKMIDTTECLFFVNTNNSVNLSTEIEQKTLSPWIYSEIYISNIIKRKPKLIHRRRQQNFSEITASRFKNLKVEYDLYLDGLVKLEDNNFINWHNNTKQKEFSALDELYNLMQIQDIKII